MIKKQFVIMLLALGLITACDQAVQHAEYYGRRQELKEEYKELTAEAQSLLNQGLYKEAIEKCDDAIAIEENNPDAHYLKGLALFSKQPPFLKKRRLKRACPEFKTAANLMHADAEVEWNRHCTN